MSKDYVFYNKKLADALMEIASIPEDELSEKEYQVYANELRRVDSLLEDLGKALTEALDENEILKGRILALAERIS